MKKWLLLSSQIIFYCCSLFFSYTSKCKVHIINFYDYIKNWVIFQECNNFINCTETNGKQITGAAAFQIHPPITLITQKDFYSNASVQQSSSIQNSHCLTSNPAACSSLQLDIFPLTFIIFVQLALILEKLAELPGKLNQDTGVSVYDTDDNMYNMQQLI